MVYKCILKPYLKNIPIKRKLSICEKVENIKKCFIRPDYFAIDGKLALVF